jgi:TonB family protein
MVAKGPFSLQENSTLERKQWEGHVIEGRFLLRQYLGGSPHSAVFATELGQGAAQKAAIKLVPADPGRAHAWMMRRELAAGLSHPGLLSILRSGTCRIDGDVCAYAVMEPSDEDLSQVIPTRPLTAKEVRELLLAVVEILAYLHAEGFVHGRLTPANIMAAGDRIKISTDGLMRAGESSDHLWAPNANDPPESRAGMIPAGDVWWLGMTLVEALTQCTPAWDPAEADDPRVPETMAAPFREIARRCLRTDPRLRCTLAEISLALQPERPAPQARPRAVKTVRAAKPAALAGAKRRSYLLPVAGAVVAGVVLTGLIVMGLRSVSSSSETGSNPPAAAAPAGTQGNSGTATVAPVAPEAVPVDHGKTADASAAASAPVAGETVPVDGGKTADAPASAPVAVETAPADGSGAAGDVVTRSVPEVPAQILGTIRGVLAVSVRVRADQSGAVMDAALDSRPGSRYFDRVSLEAARRWKFKPASDGAGRDGDVTRLVRFEFRRDGCVASSGGAAR